MQHIGQTDERCTVGLLNQIIFRFLNLVLKPFWGKEAKRYENFEYVDLYSVTMSIETKFGISDFRFPNRILNNYSNVHPTFLKKLVVNQSRIEFQISSSASWLSKQRQSERQIKFSLQ